MKLETNDIADLRPVITAVVADVLAEMRSEQQPQQKLLWSETEAAGVLGVSASYLKQLRHDGKIEAHTTIKPILYTWEQIEAIGDWLQERQ